MKKIEINFFWGGPDFDKWTSLCIKSHIKVGHKVNLWIYQNHPKTKYFEEIKNKVNVNNSSDFFDITSFMKNGGNFQTASALWRFAYLYEFGGWYADTDAYAIKQFKNNPWMVQSAEIDRKTLSIGVIHAPRNNVVLLNCIKNIKQKWGNVKVFDKFFKEQYPDYNQGNPCEFYPYTWKEWDTIYNDMKIANFKKSKSIHLYHTMLKRNNVKCEPTSKSCLLNDLINFVKEI